MKFLAKFLYGILIIVAGFFIAAFMLNRSDEEILSHLAREVNNKSQRLLNETYGIQIFSIPFGKVIFDSKEVKRDEKPLILNKAFCHPPEIVKKLSRGSAGLDILSLLNKDTLLPHKYEEIDWHRKKKGREPKTTLYNHDRLYVQRGEHVDGIFADTRDILSFIFWLGVQDYDGQNNQNTTININRTVYHVEVKNQGYVANKNAIKTKFLYLILNFNELDYRDKIVNTFPIKVYLTKQDEHFVPVYFVYDYLNWIPIKLILGEGV